MQQNDEPASAAEARPRDNGSRKELVLALIEHGCRPAAIVLVGLLVFLWLVSVKDPLLGLLDRTQELKVGGFSIRIREKARTADLIEEYKKLETLSLQQIQLFLIVGAKRDAHITYGGPEVTKENLEKIQEVGLLQDVREEGDSLKWRTTMKGEKLHAIIFDQLVAAIRNG